MIPVSIDTIFCYLFNFCTALVASFLGSVCVNLLSPIETKRKRKSGKNILIKSICYGVLVATAMSAAYDYFHFNYSLYMAISGFLGAGGDLIMNIFMNKNFVSKFIKNLFKNVKNIFLKSISESLEEIEEDEDSKKEDKAGG